MYSYYFAQHSVKKYLDKGVIIVSYEEEPDVIPPPAVVIYPINSNTTPGEPGNGWKFDVQPACSNMSGEDFIQCLETASYSADDLIKSSSMDERLQFINGSPDVIPRFLWNS